MRQDLDEKLVKDFPELYRTYYDSPEITAMCWGFECGDGWFDLIYQLSKDLTELISKEEDSDLYVAVQVKEKYGSLAFYMLVGTDKVYDLIDAAERKSLTICELCGKLGELSSNHGWYKTLCEEHRKELGYESIHT